MRGLFPGRAERHPELARALPFALLIAGIALDTVWPRLAGVPSLHGLHGWDMRWNYGLRNLAALIAIIGWLPALPELKWRGANADWRALAAQAVLAVLIGLVVFVIWISAPMAAFAQSHGGLDWQALRGSAQSLTPAVQGMTGSGFSPLDATGQMDWPLAASRLAGSALVVPVAEELFWRSLVMRTVDGAHFEQRDPRRVGGRAFWLQAMCFGAEHDLWLAGILAGVFYGWLYRRTGRLWPAILAHATTNAVLGIWVLRTGNWGYW